MPRLLATMGRLAHGSSASGPLQAIAKRPVRVVVGRLYWFVVSLAMVSRTLVVRK